MKKVDEFIGIRNIVGKTFLWMLGLIAISSQLYTHIMFGFMLTEKEPSELTLTFWGLILVGLVLVIGGVYYNKLLDKLLNKK